MNIDESLSAKFGVEPIKASKVVSITGEVISPNKIEDDYEVSRNNMRTLLQQGQEALNSALEVAKQSEHPRAFEVVGNLMKQLADINQQLLDLHSQKQKLDEPSKADKAKQVTNNAIFVGSTADLNKLIKNMVKGE